MFGKKNKPKKPCAFEGTKKIREGTKKLNIVLDDIFKRAEQQKKDARLWFDGESEEQKQSAKG